MKKIILLFTAIALTGGIQSVPAREPRLMTYNVRHCEGMDNVLDLRRTASVIERLRPDFVALQEIDSCAARTGAVDQLRELAGLTGMNGTFAAAIPLQGGSYGVAILSRERPLSVKRIPMPSRTEDRVLLVCEFRRCVVACTHLSLHEEEHAASFDMILGEAKCWSKPFYIMGDWNSEPDSPFIGGMREHFTFLSDTSAPTFPADEPQICIDYIALYNRAGKHTKARTEVIDEPAASDHRPVFCAKTL